MNSQFPLGQLAMVSFRLHTLVSLDGPLRHYKVTLVIDPTVTVADRGGNSYLIFKLCLGKSHDFLGKSQKSVNVENFRKSYGKEIGVQV
jgi:hypothetical protein